MGIICLCCGDGRCIRPRQNTCAEIENSLMRNRDKHTAHRNTRQNPVNATSHQKKRKTQKGGGKIIKVFPKTFRSAGIVFGSLGSKRGLESCNQRKQLGSWCCSSRCSPNRDNQGVMAATSKKVYQTKIYIVLATHSLPLQDFDHRTVHHLPCTSFHHDLTF